MLLAGAAQYVAEVAKADVAANQQLVQVQIRGAQMFAESDDAHTYASASSLSQPPPPPAALRLAGPMRPATFPRSRELRLPGTLLARPLVAASSKARATRKLAAAAAHPAVPRLSIIAILHHFTYICVCFGCESKTPGATPPSATKFSARYRRNTFPNILGAESTMPGCWSAYMYKWYIHGILYIKHATRTVDRW